MPLDPLHVRVIGIAVALPEARTAALAGGGAMLAHGIVDRVTKDIDLFTDRDADEAIRIVAALRVAVLAAGLRVEPAPRPPHENRFVAVDPTTEESVQVEVFPTEVACTLPCTSRWGRSCTRTISRRTRPSRCGGAANPVTTSTSAHSCSATTTLRSSHSRRARTGA